MHTIAADGPPETAPDAALRSLMLATLDDMDELIEGYLGQLRTIPGYGQVDIPSADLADTTRDALELILRKSSGLPLSARHEIVSEALGRRRAAQGVPLEVLLQAVRMVFRLLWTTLHERADDAQRAALDRSAVQLWEAIEFHTVRVHAGYLHEVSRMRRDRETERAVLLTRFLDAGRRNPALTAQLAAELGLEPEGPLLVGAAPLAAEAELRRLAGPTTQVHARNDSLLVLEPGGRAAFDWAERAGFPVGVGTAAPRLDAVPVAWRIAHELLMAAPPDASGPRTLIEDWPELVVRRLPELSQSVLGTVRQRLAPVSGESRERLLETVELYLRTGSLGGTAERLFVHRNTVLKRLARFAELTGLDPAQPWNAATIRLVLAERASHPAGPRE